MLNLYTATGILCASQYVTYCRVNMCYLSLLLPVQEELSLLPFSFSKRVIVRV